MADKKATTKKTASSGKKETIKTQNGDDTGLVFASGEIISVNTITDADLEERDRRLKEIAKLDIKDGKKISSEYWEAGEGDSIRGIFRGYKAIQAQDESGDAKVDADGNPVKVPAVVIDTLSGIKITAAMQAVDLFRSGVPIGRAVEVSCTLAKARKMKRFEVVILTETEDATETADVNE